MMVGESAPRALPGGPGAGGPGSCGRRVRAQGHAGEVDLDRSGSRVERARTVIAPGRVEVAVVEGDAGEVVSRAVARRRGEAAGPHWLAERQAVVERDGSPVVVGVRQGPGDDLDEELWLGDQPAVERLVTNAEHAGRRVGD